jgi:hypothetical protein
MSPEIRPMPPTWNGDASAPLLHLFRRCVRLFAVAQRLNAHTDDELVAMELNFGKFDLMKKWSIAYLEFFASLSSLHRGAIRRSPAGQQERHLTHRLQFVVAQEICSIGLRQIQKLEHGLPFLICVDCGSVDTPHCPKIVLMKN